MTAVDRTLPAIPIRSDKPLLSLVTPAWREAENLPLLYAELVRVLDGNGLEWEWIVVDDHSPDSTWDVILQLSLRDPRVRGVRLARNGGSHNAIRYGLSQTAGKCAAIMASDLQDPPSMLPRLVERWRAGFRVVWAVRRKREGESRATIAFARLYYWLMRHVAGMRQMPPDGADFLLLDRCVIDGLSAFRESSANLFALIAWMGFEQESVEYDKLARLHGSSGWTIAKKLTLVIDSLTAFTLAPVRWMSAAGFCSMLLALVWAAVILRNAVVGHPVQGWTSVMLAILFFGGLQMIMLGVLGEYLWRALDESRHRPMQLIEERTFRAGQRGAACACSRE
jgi:dolichol-phosphate mannosyltransferase